MNTSAVEFNLSFVIHNNVTNHKLKNSESRILAMKIATLIANFNRPRLSIALDYLYPEYIYPAARWWSMSCS